MNQKISNTNPFYNALTCCILCSKKNIYLMEFYYSVYVVLCSPIELTCGVVHADIVPFHYTGYYSDTGHVINHINNG